MFVHRRHQPFMLLDPLTHVAATLGHDELCGRTDWVHYSLSLAQELDTDKCNALVPLDFRYDTRVCIAPSSNLALIL